MISLNIVMLAYCDKLNHFRPGDALMCHAEGCAIIIPPALLMVCRRLGANPFPEQLPSSL